MKYIYEVIITITSPKSLADIYYSSDVFPTLLDIKNHNAAIVTKLTYDESHRIELLAVYNDIIDCIDYTHIVKHFEDIQNGSRYQEYFNYGSTYLLVTVARFEIADVSHHTTFIQSDIQNDIIH